jgi:uncharacterized membrane protein
MQALQAPAPASTARPTIAPASHRIAAIDWMRGLVMVLMVIDHASMAFDRNHNQVAVDSAMYAEAASTALPAAEFFTRWITHLCAPTFVFLAGASLALSVERRVGRGVNAWVIDRNILTRGAIIALMDPTIVSLGSGRWTFQVLLAIGIGMMCMAPLRRLSTSALLALGVGWIVLGEIPTGWVWDPPGNSSILAAFTVATYGSATMIVKYPVIPWLSMMVLGWVFGRHLVRVGSGTTTVSGKTVLWISGVAALVIFAVVRANAGYGDMFLHRADSSWQQWLHVSKYPPSLTYAALELGVLFLCLALLRTIELRIGIRENGAFLVFGQTAMFFYLAHRLMLEVPATYFGLRGAGDLSTAYAVAAVLILVLYPACRWYRTVKAAHPESLLKYI